MPNSYTTGFGASPAPLNVGTAKVEPKHSNRFVVTFSGGALNQDVTANVVKTDRPNTDFAEMEVHRGESKTYFAGKPTFSPVTLTLEDSLDGAVAAALELQKNAQFDTNTLAVAKNGSFYKFTTVIKEYDGSGAVVGTDTLYGSWIKTLNKSGLDYSEESQQLTFDLTLRYDLPVRT